ncbi:bile salt-activated lipase-like [Hyposmocoma kahamanoa]|uniref:bile salt-activated lipase-like n=1 Tax=Hyposmocoma kahamanoa TaxID=1477025 RepID=UPI000E6D8DA5|nr:bile salt-activated lipase-like [Hyposmocoma kahamanoa]
MKYKKKLVLFSLFAMNLVDQPAPEVEIEQGIVSGIISADGSILEYIGIPYATANSSNRFQDPYPPPKWEGVYKARYEYTCPQHIPWLGVIGSEDCLKINVYVPAKAQAPLPVMVWIHGGAFKLGSGGKMLYGPKFLLKKDVILVTFNYRLGILGFLCLGIKEAPGNAGIKDQIAALKWVKKNIAKFGGDPDNVTVFGESAGGASSSVLLASEATKGLFNRVIIQSGSVLSGRAINRNPVWVASIIAKTIGHETDDPNKLYEIFAKADYKDLIAVNAKKPLHKYSDSQVLNLPCVEKTFEGVEPAINDSPYNLLKNKPKNIPIIYGTTTQEGFFLLADETEQSLQEKNDMFLFASDLEFPSIEKAEEIDKKLKEFYFGNKKIDMSVKFKVSDLYTHLYFEMPVMLEAELLLENNTTPVYNYIFNYSGGRNFLKYGLGFGNQIGACHTDELLYLFDGYLWPYPINDKDQLMIDSMTTIWTNFAKYGHPTLSLSATLPVTWEPSTRDKLQFLYIDDRLKMGPMPNPEAYQMWRDIYNNYRRRDFINTYNTASP